MAEPIKQLNDNMEDVERLLEIHEEAAGATRGRKYNVEVLNKSGVVLLVACWEAFVEDCASAAFDILLSHANTPALFPESVRRLVANAVRGGQHDLEPWRLADGGWQAELKVHRSAVLAKYGALNTPSADNVDELFKNSIGFKSMSAQWTWHRKRSSQATADLTALIKLRGDIAHRTQASSTVLKKDVTDGVQLIRRLAAITSNRVNSYLQTNTGTKPWAVQREPGKPGRKRRGAVP